MKALPRPPAHTTPTPARLAAVLLLVPLGCGFLAHLLLGPVPGWGVLLVAFAYLGWHAHRAGAGA